MKKIISYTALLLLLVFLIIQIIPVNRVNPPVVSDIQTSQEVKKILKRACYDCHSNETVWPWYSRVAPVSWLIVHDVEEGREYLNYSTWDSYSEKEKAELIYESWEEVEEGEMPLKKYMLTHPEAKLSKADKAILQNWAKIFIPNNEINDDD